jgi:outer membrane receptor protein involved in Fe transport
MPAAARIHALAVAIVLAGPQVGTAAADTLVLENIVVTGSRIERRDFESPSPVVTVPAEAFRRTGTNSIEVTLNTLPQFVPSATSTSNNPSNDGQANVSLRGLGTQRTLVLLDGRRVVAADGRGGVDLNLLPPALLSSVEVVSGGASVAYGSDAIAGVVNLKLKDTFDGVALDGSWSGTDRGDGEEYSLGITAGTSFAAERGSLVAYVGYAERAQINQDARKVSRYPLEYFADVSDGRGPGGAFIPSGSTVTDDGINIVFSSRAVFDNLFAGYGYPPGSVPPVGKPPQAGLGVNPDGSIFTTGTGEPGSVVNFRGVRDPVMFNDRFYSLNSAPETALQMPLDRRTVFVRGKFALTDQAEAYLQGLYTYYTVNRQLESAAAGIALIPVTNPFIPADLSMLLASRLPNPTAPYRYFRRASEVGPQVAENERGVWQVTAGTRGKLRGDWSFDVYAQFGQNDRTERQTNNVRLSKLQDLTFAADGGLSICAGGFNPYLAGSLSQECASYISADAANEVTTTQTLGEVSANGPLLSLPAGELRAAVGLFYKRDEFTYDADPTLSAVLPGVPGVIGPRPDVAGFPAAPDREGDESNADAYLELLAPLLKDKPGVQSLEFGLGYRYSDHSQAGGADAYKAELLYRPVTPLRLRGSYQHAVRAPSIEELYYPPVTSQFLVPRPDPCTYNSAQRTGSDKAQVEALCLAQGMPPALLPAFSYDLRRADGVSGGNPELQPEQADTYTVGFVVTAGGADSTLGSVQLAADWYRITLEDGIGRWDSESAVARCYDPAYNPNYDAQNVYCTFFERAAETGFIHLLLLDRNIGGLETTGVDLQLDWSLDAGPGRIDANAYLTYVDTWQYSDPDGGTIEYADTLGGSGLGRSIPRWKSLLNLSYGLGGLTLFTRWQHIDGARDVNEPDFEVPAYDYLDCGASYVFEAGMLQGLTARLGVDNVFDKEPPIFPSWQQGNTDPSQYDVLGRRYYLRLQYQF